MADTSIKGDKCFHGNKDIEHHRSSTCGYKKNKINTDGRTIYLLRRNCDCGMFEKCSSTQKTNLLPQEGKLIHDSPECGWKKTKKDGGCMLRNKCVCQSPGTAGFVGNLIGTFYTQ